MHNSQGRCGKRTMEEELRKMDVVHTSTEMLLRWGGG